MKPLLPLLAALLAGCDQPKLMRMQCSHADGRRMFAIATSKPITADSFNGAEDAVCEVSLFKGGRP